MDLILLQKEDDMAIIRGLHTGTMYALSKTAEWSEKSGWFIVKRRLDGSVWTEFPRTELEKDVIQALGLNSR